ncbi:hypothetical protein ABH942_001956 [Flavobacterium sp. 28YEA47A]|uniref:hypothetical protein n=1 Tax=Flavobacterium sp. 28YEA47A TaxID=3156276 RepID=UPI0035128FCE
MKKIIWLFLGIGFISCSDKKVKPIENTTVSDTVSKPVSVKTTDEKQLIVPGKSIGLTHLGQNAETLASLGRPDFSDAAMGKAWSSWYSKDGKKNELNIYTTYKDSEMKEKVIRLIRITSPEFKTEEGISTGSTLNTIQNSYPKLVITGKYKDVGESVEIYDAIDSGVAFEIKKGNCIGIIVHETGKKAADEYITFHPDMERL